MTRLDLPAATSWLWVLWKVASPLFASVSLLYKMAEWLPAKADLALAAGQTVSLKSHQSLT